MGLLADSLRQLRGRVATWTRVMASEPWDSIVVLMTESTPEELVRVHGLDGAQQLVRRAQRVLTPDIAEKYINVHSSQSPLCLLERLQDYCYGRRMAALCSKYESMAESCDDAVLDLETGEVVSGTLTVSVSDDYEYDADASAPVRAEETRLLELWQITGAATASITELARVFQINRTTHKYRALFAQIAPDGRGKQNQSLFNDMTIRSILVPRLARLMVDGV